MLKIVTECRVVSDTASGNVAWPIVLRLLCAIMLCIWAPALLQAASLNGDEVTLQVQPRICVVPAGEQACSMQLEVSWQASTRRNACLQLQGQSVTLQCWQGQQAGTFSMTLTQTENILIQLLDAHNLDVLGEIAIPVIKRDMRDTRRRRRHAWSIF